MRHLRKLNKRSLTRHSTILGALLLLSFAGPSATAPVAPQRAEAQVFPDRQVIRWFRFEICWGHCTGGYCCGFAVEDPLL